MIPAEKIIVALDLEPDRARTLVKQLVPTIKRFKVGLQLFSSSGPDFIKHLQDLGAEIFCDLKLHDIPQTVYLASKEISKFGAFMFTVHSAGGADMLRAAVDGARDGGGDPLIVAVTLLTSIDQSGLKQIGVDKSVDNYVLSMATAAKTAGLSGVVVAVSEVPLIKKECGEKFLAVTPGIRLTTDSKDDQKRVATPQNAITAGSDFLVIGRSITASKDPVSVSKKLIGL